MAEYIKPLPDYKEEFPEYWAGTKQHKLLIQRCRACLTFRWYPRPVCGNCGSFDYDWTEVKGRGNLFSYSTVHRPPMAEFKGDVPYTVAIVELDEVSNVRLLGRLLDCPPERVKIGMPVEVSYQDVTPEVTLPCWKPA